jgi:hypothetical protein
VVQLHTLARTEAARRKDTPGWPAWAQLQNAARSLVLQASTCRDLARRLPPPAPASSPAPPAPPRTEPGAAPASDEPRAGP